MTATATSTKPTFASRVTHAYDPLTGIAFIGLDGEEAGYFVDCTTDGIAFTKIRGRELHCVAVEGYGCVCSCKGFTHRGQCRHAVAAERMIENGEV